MKKLRELHKKVRGKNVTRSWLNETYCDDEYLYSSDSHRMLITKKFKGSEKLFPVSDQKRVKQFKEVYPRTGTENTKLLRFDVPHVKYVQNSANNMPVSLNLKLDYDQLKLGGASIENKEHSLTFNLALLDLFCGKAICAFIESSSSPLVILEDNNEANLMPKTYQDFLNEGHDFVYVLMPMRKVSPVGVSITEIKFKW